MTPTRSAILPHLDAERILEIYRRAPGSEVESEKFNSPESSAALAANTFGLFLDDASQLPRLPRLENLRWQPVCGELLSSSCRELIQTSAVTFPPVLAEVE